VAGEKLGMRFSASAPKTDDIGRALDEVRLVLAENKCLWSFEMFKPKQETELVKSSAAGDEVMLVFRDCMIRQSLFMFGHHQKGSLCNMMYGFFAGALKNIMGRSSQLEIIHAGQNACYKRLTVRH
jgi:predicted hydrocarbon binding protein